MIDYPSSDQLILLHDSESSFIYHQHHGLRFQDSSIVTVCDFGCLQTTLCSFRVSNSNPIPFGPNGKIDLGSSSLEPIIVDSLIERYGSVMDAWFQTMPKLLQRILQKSNQFKQCYHLSSSATSLSMRLQGQDIQVLSMAELDDWFREYEKIVYAIEKYLQRIMILSGKQRIIFIVSGGFGRSEYLLGCLRRHFGTQIQILTDEPHLSVLKGACILGLNQSMIRQRVYRYSYGTQFSKLFDPRTDNPKAYRWGSKPNEYIASYLPFTIAGCPIPVDQQFEQIVCPANDTQTEFPFGLYYALDQSQDIDAARELITITVSIPEEYRSMGRRNRFRILMNFQLTEIKFSVIHVPSGETHNSIVVL
jgi:hypothetical protein